MLASNTMVELGDDDLEPRDPCSSVAERPYAEAIQPSATSDDGVWQTVSEVFQRTQAKLRALQDTMDELELRARGVVRRDRSLGRS